MKTLSELLALTDAELAVLFYRDVLGCYAHVPHLGGFVIVRPEHGGYVAIMNEVNAPGKMNRFDTEELAWLAVPPVSNEMWLAELDRLVEEQKFRFTFSTQELSLWNNDTDVKVPCDSASEALKRAVLVAAIYSKQQRA